jgi:hypothetical protein
VTAAFKIITADPNVKGILVNIFGGIMKCDIIAEGVIAAVKEVGLKVPLVVRLEGTNVEEGKKIIANPAYVDPGRRSRRRRAEDRLVIKRACSADSPDGVKYWRSMKMLVPVKRVIDYNVKPRVKADGTWC